MFINKKVNFVAVFIALNLLSECYGFISPYSQRVCRVRDTCVRITQCQPYMVLFDHLKRPLNTNSLVFLRHQECGFEGGLPMVCCLTPSKVPQTSTVATTPKSTNWDNIARRHVKNNREDELRKKMEALNQSFLDDFFAKRITENTDLKV